MCLVASVPTIDLQTTSKVTKIPHGIVETPDNQMNMGWEYPDLVGVGSSRRS
jgi:hypothetical protein